MNGNAYRGGRIHVLRERCPTCVFRPGNLMHFADGRLADLIETNRAADSALTCHATLYTDHNAICRGFYDMEPKTTPLQLADRLGMIVFDDYPTQEDPMTTPNQDAYEAGQQAGREAIIPERPKAHPAHTLSLRLDVTVEDGTDEEVLAERLLDLLCESPWNPEQDVPGLRSFDSIEVP